jgi:hypothetical protein
MLCRKEKNEKQRENNKRANFHKNERPKFASLSLTSTHSTVARESLVLISISLVTILVTYINPGIFLRFESTV